MLGAFFVLKTWMCCCGCEVWTLCHRFVFARSKPLERPRMKSDGDGDGSMHPASPAAVLTIMTTHPLHLKSGIYVSTVPIDLIGNAEDALS